MSSRAVTTTNANDLLFAPGASSHHRHRRGERLHDPFDVVRQPHGGPRRSRPRAPTSATATQNGSGWVMQLVAFRVAAASSDATPPSVPTGLTATAVVVVADQPGLDGVDRQRRRDRLHDLPQRDAGGHVDHDLVPGHRPRRPPTTYTYTVSAFGRGRQQLGPVDVGVDHDAVSTGRCHTADRLGHRACGWFDGVGHRDGVRGGQRRCCRRAVPARREQPRRRGHDLALLGLVGHDGGRERDRTRISARARDAAGNTRHSRRRVSRLERGEHGHVGLARSPPMRSTKGRGTTAADASGHGLAGTLANGPTWALGKYGNAVNLDGVDDDVELGNPTALQLTGSMTISAWIYSSASPPDDARGRVEAGLRTATSSTPRSTAGHARSASSSPASRAAT